jgi:Glycosyl hydrolase family 65, N-terminal domain
METSPSRRGFLALAAATGALASLPAFTAAAAPQRPTAAPAPDARHQLWWRAPADEHSLITQGLPVGDGRLGALATNDPGRELLLVTDATMWTGGRNDTLDADGQFPYGRDDFGSLTLLARLTVDLPDHDLPDHDLSAVTGYRRTLDLAQGVVTTSYARSGVTYRRQLFASRPDDVIVPHFSQSGGGAYTGTLALEGTHGETGQAADSFAGAFPNGLRYGTAVIAHGSGGSIREDGSHLTFSGCRELTVVLSGGTNYAPDASTHYRDPPSTPGRNAGWTLAISTNPHGGGGWWWHPAGNAWLCNSLWEHYEFTGSRTDLKKVYPLLKGACEFWEARLLSTNLPDSGREVLIADSDWSPEQGPLDAKGITYAQELVWALFGNYRTAAAELGRDAEYAATIGALRERLYLPVASPKTGWLEEWMSPDNLGETTHRHLSPLVGLFPGDRIRPDGSTPDDIVTGATALLTARGMDSFGWANAWRALCWARLKNAGKAYQLVLNNLRPSEDGSNGTAPDLFDIYQVEQGRGIFQIDANLGTPAAVAEMLLYSRPGRLELLPALPDAWAAAGSVTGAGARGGFVVDLHWRNGTPTEVRIRSVGGTMTSVGYAGTSRTVRLRPGGSVTLRDFAR